MSQDTKQFTPEGQYTVTVYPGQVEYVEVDDSTLGVEAGYRLSQRYVQFVPATTPLESYGFKIETTGQKDGLDHGTLTLDGQHAEWQLIQGDLEKFIVVNMQPETLSDRLARALIQLAIDNTSY